MRIPNQIVHLIRKTVLHYLFAPPEVQRNVIRTYSIRGRYGAYVFQLSHGTQQIKLYEPEKYRNNVNTPLRQRVRTIMMLARQHPEPDVTEILRELFRTYPYHLLNTEAINLRLRNFYFNSRIDTGDLIRIYKAIDPLHPNPEVDELYIQTEYAPKKTIHFAYNVDENEYYYGVNPRNNELSNLLHFIWGDELPPMPERLTAASVVKSKSIPVSHQEAVTRHKQIGEIKNTKLYEDIYNGLDGKMPPDTPQRNEDYIPEEILCKMEDEELADIIRLLQMESVKLKE